MRVCVHAYMHAHTYARTSGHTHAFSHLSRYSVSNTDVYTHVHAGMPRRVGHFGRWHMLGDRALKLARHLHECTGMCVPKCVDMCTDKCFDMCADTSSGQANSYAHTNYALS